LNNQTPVSHRKGIDSWEIVDPPQVANNSDLTASRG